MTHAEMDGLYELYALGALEPELANEIDQHLMANCAYCSQQVASAVPFTATLAGIAETRQLPSGLRDRILAAVTPAKQRTSGNWFFAVAALSTACLALVIFAVWSRSELRSAQDQLSTLRLERAQLEEALQIMSRPDTRTAQFGTAEEVPHGRVFVNRRGGLVFIGSRLPQLASNRTFQLWLVPRAGTPQSAGLFQPNAAGDSVRVSSAAVDPTETKAIAVSVEPREGSAVPTTTPILVVPLE